MDYGVAKAAPFGTRGAREFGGPLLTSRPLANAVPDCLLDGDTSENSDEPWAENAGGVVRS